MFTEAHSGRPERPSKEDAAGRVRLEIMVARSKRKGGSFGINLEQ